MKKRLLQSITLLFFASTVFIGCTKNNDEPMVEIEVESAEHSDDQTNIAVENDELANEYNNVVNNFSAFNGRESFGFFSPCDATITVDSTNTQRRITITYNGKVCNPYRTRKGVVVLTMPLMNKWKDAGSGISVEIKNLTITYLLRNKSMVINGTHSIKNVSGGLVRPVLNLGTIIHDIEGNMQIAFNSGTGRKWQIAKRRTFSFSNGLVITTTGKATVDGVTNVSEWGSNRFGNSFITAITQPMVIKQDCNFRLVSGQVTHSKLRSTITATFGLDSNGVAVNCPQGSFYCKITFAGSNGTTKTKIFPYN
ncbi:MAG: hypothetical protein ACOVNY_06425 [Chitinophagaceae bacterium]